MDLTSIIVDNLPVLITTSCLAIIILSFGLTYSRERTKENLYFFVGGIITFIYVVIYWTFFKSVLVDLSVVVTIVIIFAVLLIVTLYIGRQVIREIKGEERDGVHVG